MTAWRRAVAGEVPGAFLTVAGRWAVEVAEPGPARVAVAYARVSSHGQKADLDRQVARIAEWAAANGVVVGRFVREVGSGLSDKRRELLSRPTRHSGDNPHRRTGREPLRAR